MDATRVLDERLTHPDPAPVPLPPPLRAARDSLAGMGQRLVLIPEGALERPWAWTGESRSDVRSGIYLAAMKLQAAAGNVARALAATGLAGGPAAGALAAVTRARWDLQGVVATLDDATLDAAPGGEWTARETLAHIIDSQRAYAWFSAWWLRRAGEPDLPAQADEAHGRPLPSAAAEREGTLDQLRARLDALVDLSAWLWEPADEAVLATQARWSGFRVDIGFRTHRWAAHIVEHTIQVDKTLVLLRHSPTEVERLHRLLHRTYGDLEAAVFGLPAEALEARCGTSSVGETMVKAVAQASQLVDEVATVAS